MTRHGIPVTERLGLLVRLTGGAALGAVGWLVVAALVPSLPIAGRFFLTWFLFTFGPGVLVAGWVTRSMDSWRRAVILLGAGSAAAPVIIDLLGRFGIVPAFPFVATGLVGAGLAAWTLGARTTRDRSLTRDVIAAAAVLALAIAMGTVAFAHRLDTRTDGIRVNGEYDSADIAYYAAEASEASHTVPPTASYYSGHKLNAAYFPHLVPAMIHRFGAVPTLSVYFQLAWPTYIALTAMVAFVMVRALASTEIATLAVVLLLVGSDFSYLAAWFLPHATVDWDYVLWPTNFLSPTMQVMYFSTWSPSLPVFFTVLFTIVRGLQTRRWAWLVVSALLMAVLFEFKPFAYIVTMAALSAATVFAGGDWQARRRYVATIVMSVLFTSPFLLSAAFVDPEDRRSRLVVDPFLLPLRMLLKLDLTEAFERAARTIMPIAALQRPMLLLMASVVFLAVGVGMRWLAVPGIWRAIRAVVPASDSGDARGDAAGWRVLAWACAAGVAIPFVVATDPYIDTLQFYLTGLYLMWIFTAAALVAFARSRPRWGSAAIAATIVLAVPSSAYYLHRRWQDDTRAPRAALSRSEVVIAQYLGATDPETTVVLHDRPLAPSLMTIVSERRIVLGWDVKYSAVGAEDRLRDVEAFFDSADADPEATFEILRKYRVTHLIVRGDDRVHPAVLARLHLILRLPDVSLYTVPGPGAA